MPLGLIGSNEYKTYMHAADLKAHSLEYVTPSDPHTGA